ncbi:MAG: hypothetical protein LBC27_05500 [Spirochaetaceae bacterium]|jgi:hypothetical protein|nr:hypothetical protein [Spirochaetaceae bacterium]
MPNEYMTPKGLKKLTRYMINKYGLEKIHQYIAGYNERMEKIAKLNEDLLSSSFEKSEEEKNELIETISHVSSEYYRYITTVPRDFMTYHFNAIEMMATDEDFKQEIMQMLSGIQSINVNSIIKIQSIRPKKYIMHMDTVSNHLTSLEETTSLFVGKDKNKRPIMTSITLDIPAHMQIEGGSLSTYDKSILNGVSSLLESGNTAFSIPMLYQSMTGKINPTLEENLIEDITIRLERMRRMMITLDLTEEYFNKLIPAGNSNVIENLQIEGYLLPLNKVRGTVNGKHTEMYQIIQNPPLYSYSKLKSQLASVAIKLLNAPVNNNFTTIPLKTYLIQRIEMIKNQKNSINSQTILYESVYEELGELEATRKRKAKIRDYCEIILGHFVQESYIISFEVLRKGKIILGVEIWITNKDADISNKNALKT